MFVTSGGQRLRGRVNKSLPESGAEQLKEKQGKLYFLLCFRLIETKIENIHSANAANEGSQENIRLALARSFQIEDLKLCRYAIISLE